MAQLALWIGDVRQFEGLEHIWRYAVGYPDHIRVVDESAPFLEYRPIPNTSPPRRFIAKEVLAVMKETPPPLQACA